MTTMFTESKTGVMPFWGVQLRCGRWFIPWAGRPICPLSAFFYLPQIPILLLFGYSDNY